MSTKTKAQTEAGANSPQTQTGTIPPRVFWQLVLAVTGPLALMAARDALALTRKLGIDPLHSKTWLALLGAMLLLGAACLLALAISLPARRGISPNPVLERVQGMLAGLDRLRWLGWLMLLIGLAVYPVCLLHPYYGDLLYKQPWLRGFIFWMTALFCAQGLRLAFWRKSQASALLIAILLQSLLTRVALYLPDISNFPFAMGWSETSRFYYPALFLSQKIFGTSFSWPILHPSLHFLLSAPYLFNAPLWVHRVWQVTLRCAVLGLMAPALLSRLKIEARSTRWLAGVWIFVYLLTLPLYLHLAVPALIMLWGFSTKEKDQTRVWVCLVLASIWAGVSRLNWYPMPGILAATLYALETPVDKKGWRYLLKPGLWFLAGSGIAFLTMQVYIWLSGLSNPADFYTSLSSNMLWYRLLPNESYWLGVLPGILIFSMPLWLGWGLAAKQQGWGRKLCPHALRTGILLAALLALFIGGLLVSMKIGGGADIHNMDAYTVLLLVIFAYVYFGKVGPETAQTASVPQMLSRRELIAKTGSLVLLVLVPAWFAVQGTAAVWQYEPAQSQNTLTALQQKVDAVNAQGGQVLFITQRHLISMHMLKNVTLVPEFEREELMEMAMAQNEAYLQVFRRDMETQRFAAIIVDPLRFNYYGEQDAMGAENNAWTRFIAKRILCSYKQEAVFPNDRIAIYVPQVGEKKCR